jgi:hypothetical protein
MWKEALAAALVRTGRERPAADQLSEEVLAAIQGSLVLARALDERAVFTRSISRLRELLVKR